MASRWNGKAVWITSRLFRDPLQLEPFERRTAWNGKHFERPRSLEWWALSKANCLNGSSFEWHCISRKRSIRCPAGMWNGADFLESIVQFTAATCCGSLSSSIIHFNQYFSSDVAVVSHAKHIQRYLVSRLVHQEIHGYQTSTRDHIQPMRTVQSSFKAERIRPKHRYVQLIAATKCIPASIAFCVCDNI